MKKKKIAYLTGTRADFGLMTPVLSKIKKSRKLKLFIYVTGMHLMKEFGLTVKEVKKFSQSVKKVDAIYKADDRESMAFFLSDFLDKFTRILKKDKPDLLLVLGDRVEMLGAALSATYLGIPVAHIHGGDKTLTVDELARHAITKLASIHFVANDTAFKRVEMMGEDRWRIHKVGAPALDAIKNEKLPGRKELFSFLKIENPKRIILILQHPVSIEESHARAQIRETILAAKIFNETIILIYPNADAGGRKMIKEIERFPRSENFYTFRSLPFRYFLSLQKEASVIVGNSSSGMIESSSFGTPVVNIGTRQTGRERGDNIIDVGYNRAEIAMAIERSLNNESYRNLVRKSKNPWGDGNASKLIVEELEKLKIDEKLLAKQISY